MNPSWSGGEKSAAAPNGISFRRVRVRRAARSGPAVLCPNARPVESCTQAMKRNELHISVLGALGNAMAMTTMITGDIIALIERSADAGCDGFLADVAMCRPLDDTLFKQLVGRILEGADLSHCGINLEQHVRLQLEVGFIIHDSFRS